MPCALWRKAQSAKRKTLIVKASSICTLCAMRYALCDLPPARRDRGLAQRIRFSMAKYNHA